MNKFILLVLILAFHSCIVESLKPTLFQGDLQNVKYRYNGKLLGAQYNKDIVPNKFTRSHPELAVVAKLLLKLRKKLLKQKREHETRTKKAYHRYKIAKNKYQYSMVITKAIKRRYLKAKALYKKYKQEKREAEAHINNELSLLDQLAKIVGGEGNAISKFLKNAPKKASK